jgi:hypothetical protein
MLIKEEITILNIIVIVLNNMNKIKIPKEKNFNVIY